MILYPVMRLPACKTRVALYASGHVDRDHFFERIVGQLRAEGRPLTDMPDPDLVYHEWWKSQDHKHGLRIVRCASNDPAGYPVTVIDLKQWTRGRRVKEKS